MSVSALNVPAPTLAEELLALAAQCRAQVNGSARCCDQRFLDRLFHCLVENAGAVLLDCIATLVPARTGHANPLSREICARERIRLIGETLERVALLVAPLQRAA